MSEEMTPLGIDVAKQSLDACVRVQGKLHCTHVANSQGGWQQLQQWWQRLGVKTQQLQVCLEATGTYSDGIALFLHEQGICVSVLNPARVAAFRTSEGARTKTDKQDALFLLRYCEQKRPGAWEPLPAEQQALQVLLRRRDQLLQMLQQESNHLENSRLDAQTRQEIEEHRQQLQAQKQQVEQRAAALLGEHEELQEDCAAVASIPGVGTLSAMYALAVLGDVGRFRGASQVVAFVGVASAETSSGTSVRGSGAIGKTGSPTFRKLLYMCAMSAIRCDPDMRQWAGELRSRGKAGRVIVVAVMRKLLHLIYGVLKAKAPYDARKAFPSHYAAQGSQPAA